MKCVIAIVGPTAAGKSKLALYLAKHFHGEIVNADSRQVYRFLDIGTAKPNSQEQASIPHHLIDIVNPDDTFSLAMYKKMASKTIDEIQERGNLPFLVGGTGLYIWSMIEGWEIPEVPPDLEFRKSLEDCAAENGGSILFEKLKAIDPAAASYIVPTNLRRVIRALEIYHSTGQLASRLQQKHPPPYKTKIIGLIAERKELYSLIDSRIDEMIRQGLVEEVSGLINKGYGLTLSSMSGIGYREIGMYLDGKASLPEAVQKMKYNSHQFARRQNTWFHKDDSRISWHDICGNIQQETKKEINEFIRECEKVINGN
jgi:tRNA dimethylallyltransferase